MQSKGLVNLLPQEDYHLKKAGLIALLLLTLVLPTFGAGATSTEPALPLPVLIKLAFDVPAKLWDLKPSFSPDIVVSCDIGSDEKPKNVLLKTSSGNTEVDKIAVKNLLSLPPFWLPRTRVNRHYTFLCTACRPMPALNRPSPARAPLPLPRVGFGIPSNLWDINPATEIVVAFDVGADGKPKNLALKSFSGYAAVDQMAIEAASKLHLPPPFNGPINRHLAVLCVAFRQ